MRGVARLRDPRRRPGGGELPEREGLERHAGLFRTAGDEHIVLTVDHQGRAGLDAHERAALALPEYVERRIELEHEHARAAGHVGVAEHVDVPDAIDRDAQAHVVSVRGVRPDRGSEQHSLRRVGHDEDVRGARRARGDQIARAVEAHATRGDAGRRKRLRREEQRPGRRGEPDEAAPGRVAAQRDDTAGADRGVHPPVAADGRTRPDRARDRDAVGRADVE